MCLCFQRVDDVSKWSEEDKAGLLNNSRQVQSIKACVGLPKAERDRQSDYIVPGGSWWLEMYGSMVLFVHTCVTAPHLL